MVSKLIEIPVRTHKQVEMLDITSEIARSVQTGDIAEGILIASVLHTTAGLTINENADPDVVHDLIKQLGYLAPQRGEYKHAEGNSPAHLKSSLFGSSITVPVSGKRLVLGTWQGIYFCEFDGPRQRKVNARVIG